MNRLTLILFAAILAGCSAGEAEPERRAAIAAELERVTAVEIAETVDAPGTVTASLSADLAAKALGTITAIHVREGDRVRAGQALVEIEVRELEAQAARARAGLSEVDSAIGGAEAGVAAAMAQRDFSRATWERYRELLSRSSVSKQEFEEVETRYRAAEANLTGAQRALEQTRARRQQATAELSAAGAIASFATIRAPFDGIVTKKHLDVGAQAAPGMLLIRVDTDSRFRLDATIDEGLAGRLSPGAQIRVAIDALGVELEGTVEQVVPAIDAATRSAIVKIAIPGAPGLRTGMYGRARIPTGTRTAILVPRSAVRRDGQLEQVWIVGPAGESSLRLVRTGRTVADRIEILSGLEANERIVVSSRAPLLEGSPVEATGGQA